MPRTELQQAEHIPSIEHIVQLIDDGHYSQADAALHAELKCSAHEAELMTLKLAVAQHTLEPSRALQQVLAILRKDPQLAFALDLYREFSLLQYQAGRSCLSNSHPPPAS